MNNASEVGGNASEKQRCVYGGRQCEQRCVRQNKDVSEMEHRCVRIKAQKIVFFPGIYYALLAISYEKMYDLLMWQD